MYICFVYKAEIRWRIETTEHCPGVFIVVFLLRKVLFVKQNCAECLFWIFALPFTFSSPCTEAGTWAWNLPTVTWWATTGGRDRRPQGTTLGTIYTLQLLTCAQNTLSLGWAVNSQTPKPLLSPDSSKVSKTCKERNRSYFFQISCNLVLEFIHIAYGIHKLTNQYMPSKT